MRRARGGRKQRVALRFKRREQLKSHARVVVLRGLAVAIVIGIGAGLVMGGDTFVGRFIRQHTPVVEIPAPPVLAGFDFKPVLPRHSFWLWFPGSGSWLEKRVCKAFPSVQSMKLQRSYQGNRISMVLEPRIPLVSWNGSGLGKEGVVFPIPSGVWPELPEARFLPDADRQVISQFLTRMAAIPEVWSQVASIRETPHEMIELTLKTGTTVIWGALESETLTRKAQALLRVIDDAHKNMGGAATADLRFFEQGRIIVLPKSARR